MISPSRVRIRAVVTGAVVFLCFYDPLAASPQDVYRDACVSAYLETACEIRMLERRLSRLRLVIAAAEVTAPSDASVLKGLRTEEEQRKRDLAKAYAGYAYLKQAFGTDVAPSTDTDRAYRMAVELLRLEATLCAAVLPDSHEPLRRRARTAFQTLRNCRVELQNYSAMSTSYSRSDAEQLMAGANRALDEANEVLSEVLKIEIQSMVAERELVDRLRDLRRLVDLDETTQRGPTLLQEVTPPGEPPANGRLQIWVLPKPMFECYTEQRLGLLLKVRGGIPPYSIGPSVGGQGLSPKDIVTFRYDFVAPKEPCGHREEFVVNDSTGAKAVVWLQVKVRARKPGSSEEHVFTLEEPETKNETPGLLFQGMQNSYSIVGEQRLTLNGGMQAVRIGTSEFIRAPYSTHPPDQNNRSTWVKRITIRGPGYEMKPYSYDDGFLPMAVKPGKHSYTFLFDVEGRRREYTISLDTVPQDDARKNTDAWIGELQRQKLPRDRGTCTASLVGACVLSDTDRALGIFLQAQGERNPEFRDGFFSSVDPWAVLSLTPWMKGEEALRFFQEVERRQPDRPTWRLLRPSLFYTLAVFHMNFRDDFAAAKDAWDRMDNKYSLPRSWTER